MYMNIKQLIKYGTNELNGIEDSYLKVRILLAHILDKNKEYLIINSDEEISKEKEEEFFEKLEKLKKGYPIQYITNSQFFRNCEFYVDNNVLIPQPDTEILVEESIKIILEEQSSNVLDLCTGSGAIVISIAKELSEASKKITFWASDISEKALEIAEKNAKQNGVEINFIQSDLFEKMDNNLKFDIIISNPPYIETATIEELSTEVKNEPKIALDGGKDGLEFYRKIAKKSKDYLKENGYLALEIGYNQMDSVCEILEKNNFKILKKVKDFSNNDRVIVAQVL